MNTSTPKFKIYPTLLDSFSKYIKDEEANLQDLLDRINRVPIESEATKKGKLFNRVIDDLIISPLDIDGMDVIYVDEFYFKASVLKEVVSLLRGAISNIYTEGIIETKYGPVLLYGYIDELKGGGCIELKTTNRYEFPKFINNWQHRVYPFCLKQQGIYVDIFEYIITDFNNVYRESYVPNFDKDTINIRGICEQLIEFIMDFRDKITDKKIFSEDAVC